MTHFIPKTQPKSLYSNRLRWLSLNWIWHEVYIVTKLLQCFPSIQCLCWRESRLKKKKHLSNTITGIFEFGRIDSTIFFLFQTNDEWSLIGWKLTHFEITYETKSLLWLLFRYFCTMFWNKFHFEWRLNCIDSFMQFSMSMMYECLRIFHARSHDISKWMFRYICALFLITSLFCRIFLAYAITYWVYSNDPFRV